MARRNGGRDVVSTVFLWFMAALMIVGTAVGIKWVLNNDFGGQKNESEVTSLDSEEPGTSEEPSTTEEPPLNPQPDGLYLLEFNKEIVFNSGDFVHIINSYGGEEAYGTITKTNKILFKTHIDQPSPSIYFIWYNDHGIEFEYDKDLTVSDFQLGVNNIELSNDEATLQVSYRPFVASDSIEVNEVDALNSIGVKDYLSHNMEGYDSLPPLAKNAYRSSDNYGELVLNDKRYTYNSLKFNVETIVEDEGTYNKTGIQMGFPTVINENHTNDIFITGFNYISYILQDYTIKSNDGIHVSPEQLNVKGSLNTMFRVYRSNVDLTWKKVPLGSDLVIEADGNYYQFGIVFATNNKADNRVLYEFEL